MGYVLSRAHTLCVVTQQFFALQSVDWWLWWWS